MKRIILLLSVVGIGTFALQSCDKDKSCVCTDADGKTTTINTNEAEKQGLQKEVCDANHTLMAMDGGSCELK